MVELNRRQRAMFVDKLPDAANLAMGGLVFGQLVATGRFSTALAIVGVAIWVFFMGWGTALAEREEP